MILHASFVAILCVVSGIVWAEATPPAKWFSCKKDADCIVAGQACRPAAINGKYKAEYNASLGPSPLDCRDNPNGRTRVVCMNSTCVIKRDK